MRRLGGSMERKPSSAPDNYNWNTTEDEERMGFFELALAFVLLALVICGETITSLFHRPSKQSPSVWS